MANKTSYVLMAVDDCPACGGGKFNSISRTLCPVCKGQGRVVTLIVEAPSLDDVVSHIIKEDEGAINKLQEV